MISTDNGGRLAGVLLKNSMQILYTANQHDDDRSRPSKEEKPFEQEHATMNQRVHIGE